MEERYGVPNRATFQFDISRREFRRIRSSQKHGRNHDVTVYIARDNKLAVIAKPFYPRGLYRAPSGGLRPGEDFHEGIFREVAEEVGCEIKLARFVLRTEVKFTQEDNCIDWRSFVFTADYLRGDFRFTDHQEIREVRLATWEELGEFGAIMCRSNIGGLRYRAALHDEVRRLLFEERP